ncbi:MAG: efflux RND transporter periplasmic adaptor subunit [Bacteroidetes bacterium]|nr:efflux RND transporter periplasmic adaptor subunit [Bacteroidota bacterium]MCL2302596.1 efflux RND transporter periplasmic adaptor subunit [Lentimicrobiaceae bacterium]
MNAKKIIYISLPILAILIFVGYKFLFSKTEQPIEEQKPKGGGTLNAQLYVLEVSSLSSGINAVGTLLPNEQVDLISEAAGKVVGIYFEEGKKVLKGQLLLKVDDEELQAQLRRTEYQLKLTGERLNRQKILLDKDAVSREEFDQVQTDYNILQTDIDLLKTKIAKTEIRAPFAGTIGFRSVSLGSFLQPNTIIARLIDQSKLKLEFAIPERYGSLYLPGKKIYFQTEVSPQELEAVVYAIDPEVDIDTRTITVRGLYNNAAGKLSAGMFARINLIVNQSNETLLIPSQAVVQEMEGAKVWMISNGRAKSQPITTGYRTEKQVEVLSGLQAGDTIMITGLMQVREGIAVREQ